MQLHCSVIQHVITNGHLASNLRIFVVLENGKRIVELNAATYLEETQRDASHEMQLVDTDEEPAKPQELTFKSEIYGRRKKTSFFPGKLCYIYTSGTTGNPKPAIIHHRRFFLYGMAGEAFKVSGWGLRRRSAKNHFQKYILTYFR